MYCVIFNAVTLAGKSKTPAICLAFTTFVPSGVDISIPLVSSCCIFESVGGRRISIGGLHGPSHKALTIVFSAFIRVNGGSDVVMRSKGQRVIPDESIGERQCINYYDEQQTLHTDL